MSNLGNGPSALLLHIKGRSWLHITGVTCQWTLLLLDYWLLTSYSHFFSLYNIILRWYSSEKKWRCGINSAMANFICKWPEWFEQRLVRFCACFYGVSSGSVSLLNFLYVYFPCWRNERFTFLLIFGTFCSPTQNSQCLTSKIKAQLKTFSSFCGGKEVMLLKTWSKHHQHYVVKARLLFQLS